MVFLKLLSIWIAMDLIWLIKFVIFTAYPFYLTIRKILLYIVAPGKCVTVITGDQYEEQYNEGTLADRKRSLMGADTRLYNPLFGWSIGPSVRP